jgi:hypothetical protein
VELQRATIARVQPGKNISAVKDVVSIHLLVLIIVVVVVIGVVQMKCVPMDGARVRK